MTVAEWVRQAMREAGATRTGPLTPLTFTRLRAIAAAAQHEFPTADIDDMLRDIDAEPHGLMIFVDSNVGWSVPLTRRVTCIRHDERGRRHASSALTGSFDAVGGLESFAELAPRQMTCAPSESERNGRDINWRPVNR